MSIQGLDDARIPLLAERRQDELYTSTESQQLRVGVTDPSSSPEDTRWQVAVFLVVNAALGAGLLNFPEAYNRAGGITAASIVQGILVVFVVLALLILAHCADLNDSKTYQDVVKHLCGKRAQQLCSIGIVLYCYGTCITFLIIIGDQFDRIFASLHGPDFCHFWYFNRNFLMTASSLLFILPLCFSKRIDFLKYPSSLGVISIVYVVLLIAYQYKYATGSYPKGEIKTRPDKWMDVFNVVPVICFGYQCHVSVVPIYSCLRNRSVITFSKTIIIAIIICVLTYTCAGVFGYLTFGSLVPSDILEAYDATQPAVLIGIIALAIKTYTTYPVLQFCGRIAIESLIKNAASANRCRELHRRIVISVVWFGSTIALAIVIPNIGSVINILGSLAAIFIFVFPGICLMQATYLKDPNLYLTNDMLLIFASCCFIVIGFFIFGVVLTQAIQEIASGSSAAASLCSP